MMKKNLALIFSLLFLSGFSQGNFIKINPKINGETIVLGKKYYLAETKDTIEVKTFKVYFSNFLFLKNNKSKTLEPKYFLIDAENPESYTLKIPEKHVNSEKLKFLFGTDYKANTSGAMSGAIDPINGMYWTWQSGYINLKIEAVSSNLKSEKKEIIYHIGGYTTPFETQKNLEFEIGNKMPIEIKIDLNRFFSEVGYDKINQIMNPGKESFLISEIFAKSISKKSE